MKAQIGLLRHSGQNTRCRNQCYGCGTLCRTNNHGNQKGQWNQAKLKISRKHGNALTDSCLLEHPAKRATGCSNQDDATSAHQRLLRHVAARLFHVGERPGDGARTKLVNNLLAATNLAAAAEAIALAQQLGLDGAQTLAVIEQSSGQSWIGADRMARALAGDFEPRAHTTLLAKDSALALAMAAEAGITPTLGTQAAAMFQAALAAGYGGEDDARLLSLVRQLWRPASR